MMRHIKLYEDFEVPDLDPEMRERYIQELEKHVWRPDLYQDDIALWSAIVGGMGPEDIDPEELELGSDISSEEYQELLDDYGTIPQVQHELNYFMRMVAGYGDGSDVGDYYIMKPEEYMGRFGGLDRSLITMVMSVGTHQHHVHVEWKQVK